MKSERKRPRARWMLLSAVASAGLIAALPLASANAATALSIRVDYPQTTNCVVYTLARADGTVEKNGQTIKVAPEQRSFFIDEQVDPGDKLSFVGAEDKECDTTLDKTLGEAEYVVPDPAEDFTAVAIR